MIVDGGCFLWGGGTSHSESLFSNQKTYIYNQQKAGGPPQAEGGITNKICCIISLQSDGPALGFYARIGFWFLKGSVGDGERSHSLSSTPHGWKRPRPEGSGGAEEPGCPPP